jgi:phosphatidylglycerol---prolipoprotein diacylglyceryl transferase
MLLANNLVYHALGDLDIVGRLEVEAHHPGGAETDGVFKYCAVQDYAGRLIYTQSRKDNAMLPRIPCRYLDLFGMQIPSWGLWQLLGIAVFSVLAYFEAKRLRLKTRQWLWMIALTIVFGLIGMRLFHCLVHKDWELLFSLNGGVDSAGGFLGIAAALAYLHWKKLPIGCYLDTFAFPGAVLLIIGRIGCYCALCEKGTVTTLPWAMEYAGAARHPIALYYILSGVLLTALFLSLRKRRWQYGFLITLLISLYSFSRVLLDFLRQEPEHEYLGLSGHQVAYLVIFLISAALLWTHYTYKPDSGPKRKSF